MCVIKFLVRIILLHSLLVKAVVEDRIVSIMLLYMNTYYVIRGIITTIYLEKSLKPMSLIHFLMKEKD